jgi:hypothetical protein
MSNGEFKLKVCCMGAGYVGGPTMAVIAKQCPEVRNNPFSYPNPLLYFFKWFLFEDLWSLIVLLFKYNPHL